MYYAAFLGMTVVAWFCFTLSCKRQKYPNGPWRWPILGNLVEFKSLKARPDQELLRIAKTYGEMCMLWFGSNPVLIVNSPKVAKEMMDKVRGNQALISDLISTSN